MLHRYRLTLCPVVRQTTFRGAPRLTSLGIPREELEALKALSRSDVQYLLIGGYAMHYYGFQRPTSGVDLLVGRSPENANRLFRATEKLLGHAPDFTQAKFEEPRQQVRFGSDGYRLEILTSVDELDFEVAYKNQKHAREKRLVIPVASISDLIFIKNRIKEDKDIEFLEALLPA